MGPSTLNIPAMALGIMRMEAKTATEAAEAISTAYNSGINFIDSADIYGNGKSEEVFNAAFKKTGISREKMFIQSKAGIVPGKRYDFSKDYIIDRVNGILDRMGTDYLDSFVLHRPDALMDAEEVAEAFDILQASGKVRFFGVSNFNASQIELLRSYVTQPIMFNQLQFGIMHSGMIDFNIHTNMTDERSIDHDGQLLNYLQTHKITLQAWSPYQYGFFEGTFIDNPKFPELNKELQKLADKYKVGKNAIAGAWILRYPAQIQVLVGAMNPDHIEDAAKAGEITLTKQEWYDIYLAAGNDLP
ncbi:aldo keto reductase 2 family oxidoreductase [Lactobacillus hamsteri DSM 5661 = JCM 6256]|uniref:Aldo keto reductase 2 family oxidoreductase n=2 Tax=Lactobacillus hamsteri TaxID=96565 RepID=A0A0R1Y610_9LACO|nr:aldo keto reductase 2 family oxidoreductase [Lactobacillus hamsteri DSM 5661 = JCM 6256]